MSNRRTLIKDTAPLGPWTTLPSGISVSAIARQNEGGYARHTYRDAIAVGLACDPQVRLISPAAVWELLAVYGPAPLRTLPNDEIRSQVPRLSGEGLEAYEKRLLLDMASEDWCAYYDSLIGESDTPRVNQGKWWTHGAPKGRAHLMGLWNGVRFIQPEPARGSMGPHDDQHFDYCTLSVYEHGTRKVRRTINLNNTTEAYTDDVRDLYALMAASTHTVEFKLLDAIKAFQRSRNLHPDGIAGRDTWRALGQHWEPDLPPGDMRAPACLAALRDANKRWPTRSRASDGIMGDAAHQARPSGHNAGNAVDITHDPDSGCDGDLIAEHAIDDPRTAYVIWDHRIYNASIADYWRPYTGKNPHTHHIHIEIKPEYRDDDRPWGWVSP